MSNSQKPGGARSLAFSPVPLRRRNDGWTPLVQAEFIGQLAETQSVSKAAANVGMSRESAHRLRRKPDAGSFCAAWDRALGIEKAAIRKITAMELYQRAICGLWKPIIRGGKHVATIRKQDVNSMLRQMDRLDRAMARRLESGHV